MSQLRKSLNLKDFERKGTMKNGTTVAVALTFFTKDILHQIANFAESLGLDSREVSAGLGPVLSCFGERPENSVRVRTLPSNSTKKNKKLGRKVAVGSKSRKNRTRSKVSSDINKKVWANYTPRQKKARLKKMNDARITAQRKKVA